MSVILKRKNNSDDITAYDDALLTYSALGDGYLVRAYEGLNCSYASGAITIKSGVILFGGRIVEVPKGGSVILDVSSIPSSSTIYVILTVTIRDDDEDSDCSITAVTTRPTEGNPIAGVGTHKKVLFTLSANGRSVTRNIEGIEPGVVKNSLNLLSTGKIASKDFWDIFLDDMSGVRYAKNADVAAEAQGFVGGDINKVQANLYMPNRGVYLLQEAVLVNETNSLTFQPNESKTFTRDEFPILQGRSKVALLVSTTKQDNLTVENLPNGLVGGTPTQFILQNLTFTIYEKNQIGKGNVKVANTTSEPITIQGLHMKFLMYGGQ